PKFLFAAILTWSLGMYVHLEIAPAIVVVPVAWIVHRPSSRIIGPLLSAGLVATIVWYPYLQFEYGGDFVGLKAQMLRQAIRAINCQKSWCDRMIAPESWNQKFVLQDLESRRASTLPLWVRLKNRLVERALVIANPLLLANFPTSSDILGAGFILFVL